MGNLPFANFCRQGNGRLQVFAQNPGIDAQGMLFQKLTPRRRHFGRIQ